MLLPHSAGVRKILSKLGSELSDPQNGNFAIMFAGPTMLWEKNITSHSHSLLWQDEFRQSKCATYCYENEKTGGGLPPSHKLLFLQLFS